MRKLVMLVFAPCLIAWLLFAACSTPLRHRPEVQVEIDPADLVMFAALPDVIESESNPVTDEKVALGRMLYYDTRLSSTGEVSCNSCHDLAKYGVDSHPVSDGVKKQTGDRNSPTVYNAAGHLAQFWDGRAEHVEAQAKGPVMNPVEMAMPSEEAVVNVLKSIPGYVEAFKKAFPEEKQPVTFDNMALAIAAFERKLVTPGAWDRFMKGYAPALTNEEKTGFKAFTAAGCQACHMGTYLGGGMYQKLGVVKPWAHTKDLGRFKVTGSADDKMVFKVPTLRNVEKTAPYYHNGEIATLEEAIKAMGEYQLGRKLTDEQVNSIVVWLKTLTGQIPADYIKPPELPAAPKAAAM